MKKITISILAMAVFGMFFLPSCQTNKKKENADELKGTISISGAFALYPMTVKWAEEFRKIHPEVRIDISAGGAGKGLTDALSGMVDLGMFSRELSEAEISKGTWWIAVAKDAVVGTYNANNPMHREIQAKGLTQDELKDIFINGKAETWDFFNKKFSSDVKINTYTRSDACGAAQMWAHYLDSDQESLLGVGVYGDPGMADAIKNDPKGLGYNNIIYAYDIRKRTTHTGLAVLPLDLNNNGMIDPSEKFYSKLDTLMSAIKSGKYPSPPARELYFVTKGKPQNKRVSVFLQWILEEGQKFVNEGGYVALTEERIQAELLKL